MSEEILEGNKLIAEFMGMKFLSTHFDSAGYEQYSYSVSDEISKQVYGYTGTTTFLDNQFNTSWDWLMPVVEEIEKMEAINLKIEGVSCQICSYGFVRARETADTKKEAVWLAVVEFIKWHNQNLKK